MTFGILPYSFQKLISPLSHGQVHADDVVGLPIFAFQHASNQIRIKPSFLPKLWAIDPSTYEKTKKSPWGDYPGDLPSKPNQTPKPTSDNPIHDGTYRKEPDFPLYGG